MKNIKVILIAMLIVITVLSLVACNPEDPAEPLSYTITKEIWDALMTEENLYSLKVDGKMDVVYNVDGTFVPYSMAIDSNGRTYIEFFNFEEGRVEEKYWFGKEGEEYYQYEWNFHYGDIIKKNKVEIDEEMLESNAYTYVSLHFTSFLYRIRDSFDLITYDETTHLYSLLHEEEDYTLKYTLGFENNVMVKLKVEEAGTNGVVMEVHEFAIGKMDPIVFPEVKDTYTVNKTLWETNLSKYNFYYGKFTYTTPNVVYNFDGENLLSEQADGVKHYYDFENNVSIIDRNGVFELQKEDLNSYNFIDKHFVWIIDVVKDAFENAVYNETSKCYVYTCDSFTSGDVIYTNGTVKVYFLNGEVEKIEFTFDGNVSATILFGTCKDFEIPTVYTVTESVWNDLFGNTIEVNNGSFLALAYLDGEYHNFINTVISNVLYNVEYDTYGSGEVSFKDWFELTSYNPKHYSWKPVYGDLVLVREETQDDRYNYDYLNPNLNYFFEYLNGQFASATFDSAEKAYKYEFSTRANDHEVFIYFKNNALQKLVVIFYNTDGIEAKYIFDLTTQEDVEIPEAQSTYTVNGGLWDHLLDPNNALYTDIQSGISALGFTHEYGNKFAQARFSTYKYFDGSAYKFYNFYTGKEYTSSNEYFCEEENDIVGTKIEVLLKNNDLVLKALMGEFDNAVFNEEKNSYTVTVASKSVETISGTQGVSNLTAEVFFEDGKVLSINYTLNGVEGAYNFVDVKQPSIPEMKNEYMVTREMMESVFTIDYIASLEKFEFSYEYIDNGESTGSFTSVEFNNNQLYVVVVDGEVGNETFESFTYFERKHYDFNTNTVYDLDESGNVVSVSTFTETKGEILQNIGEISDLINSDLGEVLAIMLIVSFDKTNNMYVVQNNQLADSLLCAMSFLYDELQGFSMAIEMGDSSTACYLQTMDVRELTPPAVSEEV